MRTSAGQILTAVFLALAAVVLPLAGESGPPPARLEATRFQLPNGMTFLLFGRPELANVAAGWVVAAGSASDPDGATGLAHLLEHLMFKGTATLPEPDALDRHYTAAGGTAVNAFTTQDATVYLVSVPAERLELWFWLESDRLLAPAFLGLEAERKVIREEQRQIQGATPTGALDEPIDAAFWQAHPYRRSRWGAPGELEAAGEPEVRKFFERHYRPANLTAVLIGRFDTAAVRALAERYFGRLPAPPAPAAGSRMPEPPQESERRLGASCACPPQLVLRYHTAPFLHDDVAALEVLAALLNGRSGRLYPALVAGGLAGRATAEQVSQAAAGYLVLKAEAQGETPLAALEEGIGRVLHDLISQPVPAEELARVKNNLAADGYRRLTNPYLLAGRILANAGAGDWTWIQQQGERIRAVQPADLQRVAAAYLRPQNRLVVEIRREAPPAAIPAVQPGGMP